MRIGVDIGGTHIFAVGLCGDELTSNETSSHRSLVRRDTDYVIDTIAECIKELLPEGGAADLEGIGFAVPGNVDPLKGVTRYLPNFSWGEVDLKGLVLVRLGEEYRDVKVEMRNDGRCAALAEYKFGVGKGCDWPVFSMITLGTGIGGALVVNGKLFDGCSFDAGDFGHHSIQCVDGFHCVCGKRGCFETQASSAGLVRHYNHWVKNDTRNEYTQIDLNDAKAVVEIARTFTNEEHNENFFERWRNDLAHGLANVVTFYNPNCIAIGGGISQLPEIYHGMKPNVPDHENFMTRPRALEDQVNDLTLPATRGKCVIMQSSLGNIAGAVGAALLIEVNDKNESGNEGDSEGRSTKKRRNK